MERGVRPIGLWSTSTARDQVLDALQRPVRTDAAGRQAEGASHAAQQDVMHQRGLAGAGDARDARPGAQRQPDVEVAQVVGTSAVDREPVAVVQRPPGHDAGARLGEVPPGDRRGMRGESGRRRDGDDPAALHAGARTQVDDQVGAADRGLVVLDDQHGVAAVAQLVERVEEHGVVARMQADGRLVEDVADAAQVRAELGGQADALALAARERVGPAVEAEIAEADALEERETRADLAQRSLRHRSLARREAQGGDGARGIAHGQRREGG